MAVPVAECCSDMAKATSADCLHQHHPVVRASFVSMATVTQKGVGGVSRKRKRKTEKVNELQGKRQRSRNCLAAAAQVV